MTTQRTNTVLDELQVQFGEGISWKPEGNQTAGVLWQPTAYILIWWPNGSDSDARISQVWEQRKGRQPLPVVLLSPSDNADRLRVVGPQDRRPVRELPADRSLELLENSSGMAVRDSASFLSREFGRLEDAVMPGIRVKDLLTPHFLRDRLLLPTNKQRLQDAVGDKDFPRSGSWQSVFRTLGFEDESLQRGYLLRHESAPVAVVHPYSDPQQFSRLTERGELPEGLVLADCESQGAHWGILTAQGRYRVFQLHPPVGPATGQHFEIDVGELRPQDRLYLGLLAPQSLQEGGWLTDWVGEAKDFGEELRKGLEERLNKDALPNIARGLGEYRELQGADLSDREELRQIQEAALTLVFRFMFLLHTEARGYLPVNSLAYRPQSATSLADDCRRNLSSISRQSTSRWDRLRTLVRMVRTGDPTAGVPAYNGSLFAADGFPGSELLEFAAISDNFLAPALAAISFDTDAQDVPGLDFAGLDVGHLGAIYEKLLSFRLTRAPEDLAYDAKNDFFRPPRAGEKPEITRAQLYYQAEAGGRKAGGVYYTRREFVDHLLNHSLVPALNDHLETIKELAVTNPAEAARRLFDFSIVDPAMGSAHFLTVALDKMADRIDIFLAEIGGLPTIADQLKELTQDSSPVAQPPDAADLLRRLILKRCIFGVDISPMAVEVANVTLWLASFVPGLSLSWLGSNLKCGDALIGVADPSVLADVDRDRMFTGGQDVLSAMQEAVKLQEELAAIPDRNPDEVNRSKELGKALRAATTGLRSAFDLWAAEPLGLSKSRADLQLHGKVIVSGEDVPSSILARLAEARKIAEQYRFFHWPLEFPGVFHRDRPGFDVVVGNPPWNEVTIEELAFHALREPGLRGLPNLADRRERIAALDRENPDLRREFEERKTELATMRRFFSSLGGYQLQGVGDTDLYQLFCERYSHLVRQDGRLGVVLPRTAFLAEGAKGFRQWLFDYSVVSRIDFLLNSRRWAFDMEPRYTVALLACTRANGAERTFFTVSGPALNLSHFSEATGTRGVNVEASSLGPSRVVPLTTSQNHADLLAKLRRGVQFDSLTNPHDAQDQRGSAAASHVTPYRELDETQQRSLLSHTEGIPVWKGSSFDQYRPHGDERAGLGDWNEILDFVQRKSVRSPVFRRVFEKDILADPANHPINYSRIAFRDVTNRTNSRTVLACLVPPRVPLTNSAPYLVFSDWEPIERAVVLGLLNSLPFDWQSRRYVELHLNFYVLNMLCFPIWDNTPWQRIGELAARLSCVDERFADFAEEASVEYGPLTEAERSDKRAEIDALVAQAYGLTEDELSFIFNDFTENAVTPAYRRLVLEKFKVAEAAKWLGDTGGSAPDMENIPRRRSELA